MPHTQQYINREISWLDFNARVLQEAQDPSVPLVERIRFLGIYSNNLDEFYQVRYAAILRAIQLGSEGYDNIIDNQTNLQLIEEVNKIVAQQQIKYNKYYDKILAELEKENVFVIDESQLPLSNQQDNQTILEFINNFYQEKLSYSISVYILNPKRPAPPLRSGSLYLAIKMESNNSNQYALIDVPSKDFPRFLVLPTSSNKTYVIYLEDVIRYYLHEIFKNFNYNSISAHSIKITRDAELDMDSDVHSSFLEIVSKSVEGRKKGEPVRMVYHKEIAQDTIQFIRNILKFDDYDSIIPGGKYHNKRDLMAFPDFGKQHLRYPTLKPIKNKQLQNTACYFQYFTNKDHLICSPYHDYSVLLKFLQTAAIDTKVQKIKITIYRAAKNSQIMRSLINAARNGKQVTVVLELRARFDESNNVKWSKNLQDAGVQVIFGVPGLKVHSKVIYIEREAEHKKAEQYAIISTGNFNEATANIYTDFTLITANQKITKEVEQLFQFFDANYLIQSYKKLIVSPMQTRKTILKFIKKEIKNKSKGLPAQINMKMNSLCDKQMIDALYQASNAGVEVRLVVRGIHSLKAQMQGYSENIKSISIVDQFLEHPRVYWFKNAGDDKVFISSADLMARNLDHRIELSAPIYDPDLKQQIMQIFNYNFADNVKARLHNQNNVYANQNMQNNQPIRSQHKIYEYLTQLNDY